jgi:YVTN family beta-propeller protein
VPRGRGLVAVPLALAIGLLGCGKDATAPGPGPTLTHPAGLLQVPDTIGGYPFAVRVSRGDVAFVTQVSNGSIFRYDLPSTRTSGSFQGIGVSVDLTFTPGDSLAFVSSTSRTVSGVGFLTPVRTADNGVEPAVRIDGYPHRALADQAGTWVYVTAFPGPNGEGELYRVNVQERYVEGPLVVGFAPDGMAFGPDHSHLYVSNSHSGTISEVDVTSFSVSRTITVSGTPQDIVISPDGTELYVADRRLGLMVWDLASGVLRQTDTLPNGFLGLAMTPDGEQLYGTTFAGGTVVVINRVSRAVLRTIVTGGSPFRIAFSPSGDLALITNQNGWVDIVK